MLHADIKACFDDNIDHGALMAQVERRGTPDVPSQHVRYEGVFLTYPRPSATMVENSEQMFVSRSKR